MNLFVIDASVILHRIGNTLSRYSLDPDQQTQYIKASLLWVHQLGMLPFFRGASGCHAIWVCDSPPYWRKGVYPEYKSNRSKTRSYDYGQIKQVFNETNLPKLAVPSYEADDLAALYCRLFQRRSLDSQWSHTYLITVDSDWQGLINPNCTWVGVGGHEPSVRDTEICYQWMGRQVSKLSKRKQKLWELPPIEEFSPSLIWDWKHHVGDMSDNLKEGCDKCLIDLWHPCDGYDPMDDRSVVDRAWQLINKSVDWTHPIEINDLELLIGSMGLAPPIGYIVNSMFPLLTRR